MKKIILIIAVVMLWSFTTLNTNDPYCVGWEKGYCEGWKYIEGEFSVCPVAPVCLYLELTNTNLKMGTTEDS